MVWDQLFFKVLSFLVTPPPAGPDTHPTYPNQHLRPITIVPIPTSPVQKSQKSASMCRQRRLLALSASNDVAGVWKHFAMSSTSVKYYLMVPLHGATNSNNQKWQGVQEHAGGQNHLHVSYPLRLPTNNALPRTNKGCPHSPHPAVNQAKNTKTPPASPECASALPGDDRALLCARFRRRPPPGSPIGLPGKFQRCRSRGMGRYTGWFLATRVYLVLSGPPSTAQWLERTKTIPYPLALQKPDQKTQKHRQRRRNVLRRFLATLATIRRNYAPGFDGAHPQGVQWDSLGSFKAVGCREVVDTLALRAFLVRAASAIVLYVL
jgi:hypothetical protein